MHRGRTNSKTHRSVAGTEIFLKLFKKLYLKKDERRVMESLISFRKELKYIGPCKFTENLRRLVLQKGRWSDFFRRFTTFTERKVPFKKEKKTMFRCAGVK